MAIGEVCARTLFEHRAPLVDDGTEREALLLGRSPLRLGQGVDVGGGVEGTLEGDCEIVPGPFEDLGQRPGDADDRRLLELLVGDDGARAVDLDQGAVGPVMGLDDGFPAVGMEAREITETVGGVHRVNSRSVG